MTQHNLVITSDAHIHPWGAFSTGAGVANDRLLRTIDALGVSLEKARELECQWVFAGDWVHTIGSVQNVVLNTLIDLLCEYEDVTKLGVSGNHDGRSRGSRISKKETVVEALMRACPRLFILDDELYVPVEAEDITFYGKGYQPGEIELGDAITDVGIYHGIVSGSASGSGHVFEQGAFTVENLLARHTLSIVGDIHHPQILAATEDHRGVLVPGSLEQHNFGDRGKHGYWIATLSDGRIKDLEQVDSGSPRFLTVDTAEEVEDDGNFYRVRQAVSGDLPKNAVAVRIVPEARPRIPGLEGSATPDAAIDAWVGASKDGIDKTLAAEVGRQLIAEFTPPQLRDARLTRVEVENFMCYEYADISIEEGITLITGEGTDYRSNGAGKTAIFDAVYWCLFGRTTKGMSADDIIRRGETRAQVKIMVDLGGEDYLVLTRERKPDERTLSALVYSYDGGEQPSVLEGSSVKSTQEKVLELLGLTPEVFKALAYYPQEDVFLFSKATDAERKDMLSDLLGLRAYVEAAKKATSETSKVQSDLKAQTFAAEAVREQRDAAYAKYVKSTEESSAWELGRASRMSEATATVKERLEEVKAKELEVAERPTASLPSTEELEKVKDELRTLQSTRRELDAELERKKVEFATAQKQHAAYTERKCPQCGQAISSVEAAEKRGEVWGRVKGIVLAIEKLRKDLEELPAETDLYDRARALEAEQIEGRQEYDCRHALKATLDGLRLKLESARSHLRGIEAEENPSEKLAESWADEAEKLGQDILKREGELKSLATRVNVLEFWSRGFGRQGIQSHLLADIVRSFNDSRGDILPLMTGGVYDVVFSPISETKTGELRERSEFQIYRRGERVAYESLSGGQKRRIDLGVMFSLLLAVCRTRNIRGVLGVLFLDEVMDGFDDPECLAFTLGQLNETIPYIYLISHTQQDLFPKTLHVIQDEKGVTRVA